MSEPLDPAPKGPQAQDPEARAEVAEDDFTKRRHAVRLSTVFTGKICQFGKSYECVISDVSVGGAKVRLKNPRDFPRITREGEVQLIFERLSDYKALNATAAWFKPNEHVVGLSFVDPELRRRVVIKRLMPNRWRIANEQGAPSPGGEEHDSDTGED
ncbi:PilZ domain-containing protein [Pseudomonadota bacterium]